MSADDTDSAEDTDPVGDAGPSGPAGDHVGEWPAAGDDRDRDAQGRPANARPRDRYGQPLPRGSRDELGDRPDPDEIGTTFEATLGQAVALFDAERFFEAHDFFEHIWKSEWVEDADRNFWKGVTQVAVGCVHTQRRNQGGATALLESAVAYLEPYPATYYGVDAGALVAEARALAARVAERGASPDHDFPRFPLAE